MSIIKHEIKKIWNWKLLLVIAAMCFLFYFAFMEFNISSMRNPQASGLASDLKKELTERFGTSVTEAEMDAFLVETSTMLVDEANEHIQRIPIFAEAGIYSYSDFRTIPDMSREEYQELLDLFAFDSETNQIGLRLTAFGLLASSWDSQRTRFEYQFSAAYFTHREWLHTWNMESCHF